MSSEKPHIFVTCYGGGHVNIALPVAKRLRDEGWKVTFLALTTAAKVVKADGFSYISMTDLLAYADERSIEFGERLCPNLDHHGPVSPEETIAYHGICFADLVQEHGEYRASRMFREQGRQAFMPVAFMKRVLSGIAADVVFATNSPRLEQAAITAAAQIGTPSVCAIDMFALQEIKWIGKPGFGNKLCVLNEAVRDTFIKAGREEGELVVTGNPAFEAILEGCTRAAGAEMRRAKKWDDGKLNILWASQQEPLRHPFDRQKSGDPALPRKIEEKLRSIVAKDERVRLIVRYHPNEQIEFVDAPRVELSSNSEPLHHLLHAVDLVVVTASTVGLEAWIAHKPVIALNFSIFTADAPFSDMGIGAGTESLEGLEKMIESMAGKAPEFPLVGQVPPVGSDCSATDRIVAVIKKLKSHCAE